MPHDLSVDPQRTTDQPVSPPTDTVDVTRPYDGTNPSVAAPPAGAPTIPGYHVTGAIARGGMGQVWSVYDLELEREVAIKALLPGADAERFVTEAKITAQLPHPAIPPVYRLGTLADGTHYLAMKLVRGQTLAQLLKDRQSPKDGLTRWVQVFEQICQAVGFAHARGIIHRDLKPLNVMVGEFGEVQVMDWGLARVQASCERQRPEAPESTGTPAHTQSGAIIGTPSYMAPEQARGEVVDQRADVFALGGILTVILTGQPPFVATTARETIAKAAGADLAEALARLNECGADRELIDLARRCLAARTEGRPTDANAVAALATAYRLGVETRLRQAETERAEALVREAEQSKRRRVWLGLAATLLLGVLASSTLAVWANAARQDAAHRAEGERLAKLAVEGERDAKERARQLEQQERTYAQAIADFVKNDFLALTSVEGQTRFAGASTVQLDKDATLRQLLDRAAAKLNERQDLDPRIEADLRWMIGVNYRGMGEARLAIPFLERSAALRNQAFGPDHPQTLSARNSLALAYDNAGRSDLALPLHEENLKRHVASGRADDPFTLQCMNNLGVTYRDAGRNDLALPLLEEALRLRRAKLGHDHVDTLESMNNLATGHAESGRFDLAVPLLEETLRLLNAKHKADHPNALAAMSNLASFYLAVNKLDLALPMLEESFKLKQATLGPDHPSTLNSMNNLAGGYRQIGQLDKALPLHEEALKISKAKLGADHPDTLQNMHNLAGAYRAVAKLDRALVLYEETLRLRLATLGPEHPDTLRSMNVLATSYLDAQKYNLALPLGEEALRLTKARLGPDHQDTLVSMHNLASCYRAGGRHDLALPLFEEAVILMKAKQGTNHPNTIANMNNLAVGYQAAKMLRLAVPLFEEVLEFRKAKLGPDHPETLISMHNLALGYRDVGRHAEALALLQAAAAGVEQRGFRQQHAGPMVANLVDAHERLGQHPQAESWRRKWLAVVRERTEPDALSYASGLAGLGQNLLRQDKWTDAEATLRDSLAIQAKREPDGWLTFNVQSMLGAALLGQKKYSEAEPLLLEGYEGLRRALERKPDASGQSETDDKTGRTIAATLIQARERLIRLYEAQGKPDEAARLRAK